MKSVILTSAAILGSLSQIAPAASQTSILKNRIAEKDRVIRSLEQEIESMHKLLAKNNLRPSKKYIAKSSTSKGASYTIRKGDNLSSIAKRNGVSLRALLAVNKGINPRRLKIGQKISLPSSAKRKVSTTTVAPQPTVANNTPSKRKSYGTLPAPIKPGSNIQSGETTTTVATSSYTVQRKDTLYGIAKKHKTSVANILELNRGINPNKLQVGQKIKVTAAAKKAAAKKATQVAKAPASKKAAPKAEVAKKAVASKPIPKPAEVAKAPKKAPVVEKAPVVKDPAPAPAVAEAPQVRTVSVTSQMTFGEFAKQYNASVEQLNEMNNLRLTQSTVLAQGSELYVPNAL